MKKSLILSIMILALTLSGCENDKNEVIKVVDNLLIDPDSAKYKDFISNKDNTLSCITVNAKNRLGGYTGYTIVELKKFDKKWEVITMDGSLEKCTKRHFDIRFKLKEILIKYPGFFPEHSEYLPDSSVEELLEALADAIKAGKRKGLTEKQVIQDIHDDMGKK